MRRLWIGFSLVMVLSFLALGWLGSRIYQEAPPLPLRVVTTDGTEVIGENQIQEGQNVWQSLGGMEVGSVWGHGSYVAPDWTADWSTPPMLSKKRKRPNDAVDLCRSQRPLEWRTRFCR